MPTKRKVNETAPAVLEDTTEAPVKKAPVRREDPIARAERLLEEAKAKAKEAAAKQLTNAEDALVLAEASLLKALKVHTERRNRVIALRDRLDEPYQVPLKASSLLFGRDVEESGDTRPTLQELVDAEDPGYTGILDEAPTAHRDIQSIASEVLDLNDKVDSKTEAAA